MCNIIHLLHLLLITGVWGIHEDTSLFPSTEGSSGSAKRSSSFAWVRKISNSCRLSIQVFMNIPKYASTHFFLSMSVSYCRYEISGLDETEWNTKHLPFLNKMNAQHRFRRTCFPQTSSGLHPHLQTPLNTLFRHQAPSQLPCQDQNQIELQSTKVVPASDGNKVDDRP